MKLNNVKVGERLSLTYYLEVLSKSGDSLKVRDHNKMEFEIRGKDLIEGTIQSASQFSKTEKVSRTAVVDILENAKDTVFTVNFDKVDGSNRTLIGHLLASEGKMGRTNVIDLEVTAGHNMRQVDNRSIHFLIINDVKYQVK